MKMVSCKSDYGRFAGPLTNLPFEPCRAIQYATMKRFHTATSAMPDWADREAEHIVDKFVAYEGPDDLLRLQQSIAAALRAARSSDPNAPPDTGAKRSKGRASGKHR